MSDLYHDTDLKRYNDDELAVIDEQVRALEAAADKLNASMRRVVRGVMTFDRSSERISVDTYSLRMAVQLELAERTVASDRAQALRDSYSITTE